MKESTFLPERGLLFFIVVVERNEKSFSLKCCLDKSKLFTHVKEHAQSEHFQSRQSAQSQVLGCTRGHPQRGPYGPSRTRMNDDFYITHTRADSCGRTDSESMNWP